MTYVGYSEVDPLTFRDADGKTTGAAAEVESHLDAI